MLILFPCPVKVMEDVVLPSDAAAEELISCSPVFEVLKICLTKDDVLEALRVFSLSLGSFALKRVEPVDTDALITSVAEFFKVDIDVEFKLLTDYSSGKKIIDNLLSNFSGVKDMTMSWRTLQIFV
ncbi:hypothetical protein Bca52824_089761 [Brassica carinata]|uniref:Uncharacterized protein n=1 Tax=Brassica carinata TaxID=52824 RepID=A0A8X7NTE6_BRACI|nr:hypothetical protein Bca52824_089761 [Brassica carinata]